MNFLIPLFLFNFQVHLPAYAVVPCDMNPQYPMNPSELISAGVITHPCNRSMQVTYLDSPRLDLCNMISTRIWTIKDDCGLTTIFYQILKVLPLQFPLEPQNGELNVDIRRVLRWPDYPYSEQYRIYVWRFGTKRPTRPTRVSFYRSYAPQIAYLPDTKMLWQVEFVLKDGVLENNASVVPSPVWGFQTKQYPDLKVLSVSCPSYTFSGRSFDISWIVKNIGSSGTSVYYWYDRVYVATSASASRGQLTKTIYRRSFLDPGDGYTGRATLQVPDYMIGSYFVFVETDIYRRTSDIDMTNNKGRSITSVQIRLTPPPDLQVKRVVIPMTTFSGRTLLLFAKAICFSRMVVLKCLKYYEKCLLYS